MILIFELDRDINEIKLWEKNQERSDDFFVSYRVNGRTHRPILECTHFLSTQK